MPDQALIDEDPRPELEKDSEIWSYVLKNLAQDNIQSAVNMKHLRRAGARLEYNSEAEKVELKLDPSDDSSLITAEEFKKYLKKLVHPYKTEVRAVLDEVAERTREARA